MNPAPDKTIIYLEDVTVSFDGFKALNNLTFWMQPGELRVIIGPNGAGKTTMLDVITGKVKPQLGRILFGDDIKHNLTQLNETRIAALGIGRKFQTPTVFTQLTVIENIELALRRGRSVREALFARLSAAQRERVDEILTLIDLVPLRGRLAGTLSHGQKQWLEIGMLVAQDPLLMLVDEPAAGLTDHDTARTAELLKRIAQDHSVLVIDHDMEFVRSIANIVSVLHEGHLLCEGTVDEVQNNERVREVYLGRERKN